MPNASANPDQTAAEGQSFPAPPLLVEDRPPLRPSLLDVNPTRRRMENLDALRILAMLVIIVTHVTQPYLDHAADALPYDGLYQSVFSLNVACRFGVPCFMMISFFIYWHQLYDKNRTWGELLKRRFARLVPAFLAWSLFYFALHKFLEPRGLNVEPGPLGTGPDARLNWKNPSVWYEILVAGRAHDHLYYLPVILCSLLLIPLLRVLWRRPALAWTWIAITLFAWTAVAYGSAFLPAEAGPTKVVAATLKLWQNVLVIPLLIFPLLGMMSAGLQPWRTFIANSPTAAWIALLIFGVVLHTAETLILLPHDYITALNGLKLGRFITALAVFVLFLRSPLMRDPFPRISHYAFGLHFMHPAVIIGLLLLERRFIGAPIATWETLVVPVLIINFILTFFITFGLCLLIGRVKRLEFLVV